MLLEVFDSVLDSVSAVLQCVHGRLIWVSWCVAEEGLQGGSSVHCPFSICCADPCEVQIMWFLVCGNDSTC